MNLIKSKIYKKDIIYKISVGKREIWACHNHLQVLQIVKAIGYMCDSIIKILDCLGNKHSIIKIKNIIYQY